jgi:hypothetical protein
VVFTWWYGWWEDLLEHVSQVVQAVGHGLGQAARDGPARQQRRQLRKKKKIKSIKFHLVKLMSQKISIS